MVSVLVRDRRAARRTQSPQPTKEIESLPCVTCEARIEPPHGQHRHARRCACESEMRAGSARGTRAWATWLRLRWQSYRGAAAPAAPLGRVVRIVRSADGKMGSSSLHRPSRDSAAPPSLSSSELGVAPRQSQKELVESFQGLCGRPPEPNGRPRSAWRSAGGGASPV